MAIQITSTPATFASAHAQNLLTVYDNTKPQDSTTYPNYKYVCDVYIDGTLITRLKAYPDPEQLAGVFDIGPVVRSYLASNFDPQTTAIGNQYRPYVRAQCKIGEEYNGTTYTNLIEDSERLYFDTYKTGRWTNNSVIGDKVNDFATSRPTITVDEDSSYILVPFFATASGTINYTKGYTSTDGEVGSVAATGSVLYPSGMVHFNMSRSALGLGSDIAEATITVSGTTVGVRYGCSPKFTAYTVAFLNKYGGYETYDFRLLSRKKMQIDRKTYEQEVYRLGASGAVTYGSGARYYNGRGTYSSRQKQSITLNTDWLSDAEYTWLAELAASTETWLLLDGMFTPCTLQISEYVYRTGVADKLTQLTVDVEFDGDYNSQYR